MQETLKKSEVIEVKQGTIVSPIGFMAAGTHAGLRYSKKDLGILMSDVPANCAAVYTTSHFQAPPLKVTKNSLSKAGWIQAVIVNSACANACTGSKGLKDAYQMRNLAARKLKIEDHLVAVASTGVIGEYLQMGKIEKGVQSLVLQRTKSSAEDFQSAILTTDLVMKNCCYSAVIGGKCVTMGGAAKGSGMIHPNMGTMLAFITTDAKVDTDSLTNALKLVTEDSFNQITVDGDTSTNDMVIVMANGLSGASPINEFHQDWPVFLELLSKTCISLAKQIARDGEGATKLIEVLVNGCRSNEEAKIIAKTIVGSNLVKTAIHGADANWGRIISAIGQSPVDIKPDKVDISIGPLSMLKNSEIQPFSEEAARLYLKRDLIEIRINLHSGKGQGVAWGCDLSYDYVKINANYRT